MNTNTSLENIKGRPILIGYLPTLGGIPKTSNHYLANSRFINTGDLAYTYSATLLCTGKNFIPWDFILSAEEVNEKFSRVIFFLPCRIAPPPYGEDGFPFEFVTKFIEKLTIPFTSISESVQSSHYEYTANLAKQLQPNVTRYLHTIADHSTVVGTRGEYSADILRRIGISNVEPIGCPSLYINGPSLHPNLTSKKSFDEVKNISVCYSNYQNLKHSRIKDILKLACDNGYQYVEQSFNLIVKALHYPHMIEAVDIYNARKFYHGLEEINFLLGNQQVHYFTNYQIWKKFLSNMDFVFGARMHGLTPALHAGVPSLFITHDARVREICEFFNLPFIAEKDLPSAGNLSAEHFYSLSNFEPAAKTYKDRYKNFIDFLKINGITPNVTSNGEIRDYWEPTPHPEVLESETLRPNMLDGEKFSQICKQLVG